MFFILVFSGTRLRAQEISIAVDGKITDEYYKPLQGVIVTSENGRNGSITDINGEYAIIVNDNSKSLLFSFPGHILQKLAIGEHKQLDVKLVYDAHHKDDFVQLGYSEQRRGDLTGAVSTVSGAELERAPVANLTQTLAGRLNGLFTQETFSELSRANTNLYIRGISSARKNGPLVIIDGIINSYNSNQTLDYISANEIESVTILKDASTQALYGIQGANGLIVVKTKRGVKGGLQIKTRFDQSFQEVTTKPAFYNSADYAQLRNQAAFNDGLGQNYLFSPSQIAGYRSGENKELYPNNNWYSQFMKDFAMMQRVGVNVTGGNDKVQFFSNINFMHQGGQFKTDQTRYDPNANNVWVNYRTNIDMKLNNYLKAFVRLSGNVKRERTPGASNDEVYRSLFMMPPTTYGPVTPAVINGGEIVDPGGKVITTERVESPTYGMLNRTGYRRHTVTNITSQFGLDLDMSFLTKGLNLTGVMAYQTNSVGSLSTTQNYERYVRNNDSTTLGFNKKGSANNTPLAYGKSHSYYYHLTYNIAMNYKRDFGRHNVSALAYMFYQNLTKADNSSPNLLPYNRVSSGFEATYGFENKYLLKFDLGYSGSEQYARSNRFIATPAISGAWVISNEAFLRDQHLLSYLKLRASYGKTANDQSGLARYAYLDNVTVSKGGTINYLQYIVQENQRANPNIQAEVATKQNLGVDLGLLKAFNISVDVFKERMNNMVVSALATIPLYQGIPLSNYPTTNSGTFENKGVEISVNYNKSVNRNLSVFVGGMIGYAKNTIVNWNEARKTEDYAFRKWQEGYSFGQEFGYLVDYSNGNGFFNTQAELMQSNLTYGFGVPRLGDLKFRDLNGDHKIDDRDKAPIGNGSIPRTTYAVSGGLKFKGFDLNLLFQGVGKYASIIGGQGVWETTYDGVFGSLHKEAWTQERYEKGEKIASPALSLAKTVNHEASDYYNYNRSYVRLKNLELGYTLPLHVSKVISAEKLRVLVSGQNLITWDKMKSKDFGPENSDYATFPVYRVFNIGVNVIF
ncbi:SusC/RagA family TonB-linked outer membrane protein [Dyadobacter sp. LHD-138]|uniref:SusC/RagA family TonB-linked outer membrane protein n=1 Tax=Dyadobacter sp. LHD-138 TaxID=3071413 RepID=UPI0027DF8F1A|nr:SusC/RagA family TonB-linked outer membrane protein [Dyadobacter sp. LHD-138]MDQ6477189.1 SusC/RagA family TonB-linked outer membrane protein [Dyadobacter sp. LHD-138]